MRVDTPTVIGWLRPVVLLPVAALANLTPDQVQAILAHELAHVRRHDFVVNLLQTIAETLLFYHPAVWWLSHRIRVEREHCCDDIAVEVCGDPVGYAEALTTLAAWARLRARAGGRVAPIHRWRWRRPAVRCCIAFAGCCGSPLTASAAVRRRRSSSRATVLLVLVVGAAAAGGGADAAAAR